MKEERIEWRWSDHPIGFPADPDDHDMKGPRTPPEASLMARYKDGETDIMVGVAYVGKSKRQICATYLEEEMKADLRKQIQEKLNERAG